MSVEQSGVHESEWKWSFKWLIFRVAIVLAFLGQSWICLLSWPPVGFSICPEQKCSNPDGNYMVTPTGPCPGQTFSPVEVAVLTLATLICSRNRGLKSCPGLGRVARVQDSACHCREPGYSKKDSAPPQRSPSWLWPGGPSPEHGTSKWDHAIWGTCGEKVPGLPSGSCGSSPGLEARMHPGSSQNNPS